VFQEAGITLILLQACSATRTDLVRVDEVFAASELVDCAVDAADGFVEGLRLQEL
jgi:hypothetical protein